MYISNPVPEVSASLYISYIDIYMNKCLKSLYTGINAQNLKKKKVVCGSACIVGHHDVMTYRALVGANKVYDQQHHSFIFSV